jgi:hypothetical protein
LVETGKISSSTFKLRRREGGKKRGREGGREGGREEARERRRG